MPNGWTLRAGSQTCSRWSKPLPGPFDCRKVGTAVNNARNDFPELLAAI